MLSITSSVVGMVETKIVFVSHINTSFPKWRLYTYSPRAEIYWLDPTQKITSLETIHKFKELHKGDKIELTYYLIPCKTYFKKFITDIKSKTNSDDDGDDDVDVDVKLDPVNF
eukprot:TRINITY_DN3267_c0_g1_i1.p1 TRINITY_DN3267_c0_g1~~TRINITY_DN3267_c0_g1_i1.p1  ORF type:complete len:113 (+),score=21.04 TRINITY_DN3267_c0_g1_i1:226-564(+)